MPTYYTILGLQSKQHSLDLTPQEVKSAYRRALLTHHPDKSQTAPIGIDVASAKRTPTVDEIALAYKTLSEPGLRSQYDKLLAKADAEQSCQRSRHTGLETVDLDDLAYDEKAGQWTRRCNCGHSSGFVVTEAELESNVQEGEVIVGCGGCSLWLRILFGVEE